jgi:MoxR-like ATPase
MRFTTRKEAITMTMRKKSAAPAAKSKSNTPGSPEGEQEKVKQSPQGKPSPRPGAPKLGSYLTSLGAYGFRDLEPVLLAALVTEDPILLIGKSGTGKTFLLNSISEALGLEHRHYNASLVSFDDLVGFPYPDDARESVRFLETPATIWSAESVLVDEISRCKPEHQNRFFSLVHERRVQGMALEKLRYRWAAMNPSTPDQGGSEDYAGSEPLDPALADRFAVVLEVGDWGELSHEDRARVADPSGEGARADDGGALVRQLATWRAEFLRQLPGTPECLRNYACSAVTTLGEAGIRLSPRRARLLVRTLLAITIVCGKSSERVFCRVLGWSLPHRAWGENPSLDVVKVAHRQAWGACIAEGDDAWVHLFHTEPRLDEKVRLLLESCPSHDTGTLAVEQLLANASPPRAAAFAFAVYPAAVERKLCLGAESVTDLGRLASELLTIDGQVTWQERLSESNTQLSEVVLVGELLAKLSGPRLARARQLFYWCLVNKHVISHPKDLEAEFNRCVEAIRKALEDDKAAGRVSA